MENEMQTNDAAPVEATETETETKITLDDVVKQFFLPSELENGIAAVQSYIDAGLPVKWNYDFQNVDFPATHGLLISPIQKRAEVKNAKGETEGKTVVVGILAAAVPTVDSLIAFGDAGQAFVKDAAERMLFAKVVNAVRPRDDGAEISVPFTIEEYITSKRATDSLSAFNEIAPIYVKALKKKGLTRLTAAILRDTLSSKANAEQFFPKIPQGMWVEVLRMMAKKAETEKLDPSIYAVWERDRDQAAGHSEIDNLNLDDLAAV